MSNIIPPVVDGVLFMPDAFSDNATVQEQIWYLYNLLMNMALDQGIVGPQGPAGPAGPQGPAGTNGADGAMGTAGPAGADGITPSFPQVVANQLPEGSSPTIQINTVAPGQFQFVLGVPAGATGATGPAGADSNVPGPQGPPGAAGADGTPGAAGADGQPFILKGRVTDSSALPVNPSPGDAYFLNDGTLYYYNNGWNNLGNFMGPQGAAGANGADGAMGPAGPAGPAGADGATGSPGADGAPGTQGPAGPAGATGPQGEPGQDGTNGSDGAPGADGLTPQLTFETPATLAPGDPATVTVNFTAPNLYDITLGLPQGAAGATGPAGPQGPEGPPGSGVPGGVAYALITRNTSAAASSTDQLTFTITSALDAPTTGQPVIIECIDGVPVRTDGIFYYVMSGTSTSSYNGSPFQVLLTDQTAIPPDFGSFNANRRSGIGGWIIPPEFVAVGTIIAASNNTIILHVSNIDLAPFSRPFNVGGSPSAGTGSAANQWNAIQLVDSDNGVLNSSTTELTLNWNVGNAWFPGIISAATGNTEMNRSLIRADNVNFPGLADYGWGNSTRPTSQELASGLTMNFINRVTGVMSGQTMNIRRVNIRTVRNVIGYNASFDPKLICHISDNSGTPSHVGVTVGFIPGRELYLVPTGNPDNVVGGIDYLSDLNQPRARPIPIATDDAVANFNAGVSGFTVAGLPLGESTIGIASS